MEASLFEPERGGDARMISAHRPSGSVAVWTRLENRDSTREDPQGEAAYR